MAEVILKNAEVMRLIEGYGASVAETYKTRDGETGQAYFTLWTKEQLSVGEVLNVKGLLSVKMDEYEKNGETHRRASVSINNASIEKVDVTF